MTDFAQDHSALRSRGPSLPKLNLLPASHFLQSQHPFDTSKNTADGDFEMDMGLDFGTSPTNSMNEVSAAPRPFVSAHPSPDLSDESDCEPGLGLGAVHSPVEQQSMVASSAPVAVPPSAKQLERDQDRRRRSQMQSESPLSHHLFLAPVPIPSSRTPPNGSFHYGKRLSVSMNTPPGSATAVPAAPCSDSAAVDALIREHVHANMITHSTDKSFFWHLGNLSEFSFSDRFVRSRVFEIKDNAVAADPNAASEMQPVPSDTTGTPTSKNQQNATSSWRLRLYPHGRGDRHRDSEYVGLYLQQDMVRAIANRRSSVVPPLAADSMAFSTSAPAPFFARGSFSSSPRRSISGASSLPVIRRHVTLFIATENGDCLAKQDLVEWFSGSEGGLGFPRIVSRKAVQDAVKGSSVIDDDEEDSELGIVAGVIFHDL
ncbi:hypothetical protein BGZ54_001802 [Gamsiella multidivaricata]|nr:hypothetical protein BGZ54_001802 [Gamsiella multidivaricata]